MKNYRRGSSLEGRFGNADRKNFRSADWSRGCGRGCEYVCLLRVLFFQRCRERRHASHSKGRHGRCHNGDASSMLKDLCRLSKDTVRCLCCLDKQWLCTCTRRRLRAHDAVRGVWYLCLRCPVLLAPVVGAAGIGRLVDIRHIHRSSRDVPGICLRL